MLSSTLRLSVSRRLVSPLVLRPATPSTSSRPFSVLVDPSHATETTPQFVVGVNNGFLPRQLPLVKLPNEFKELESLLQRMPVTRADGKPGLLAKGEFGNAVKAELPEYNVDNIKDTRLLTALFRDYTFAASSYLLEPCDLLYRKKKEYGLGRQTLPRNIAVPLHKVATKIGSKPFMEYAQSYSLYNYQLVDPNAKNPLAYENLKLIRAFGGQPSEHGFILVHVAMVAHSGDVVKYSLASLDAVEKKDRKALDTAFTGLLNAFRRIQNVMDTMWKHSLPGDYDDFRTFIMGTKNQPMFPNGVIYEGVSSEPTFFRGESGANDSMIPTADNLLELTAKMPSNPLTETLRDFRSYRPSNHNQWVSWVEKRAQELGVRDFALQDANTGVLYLALLDQVREFRNRHWNFTKEYIIKYSKHNVGTGGSPIVTWLPNQLSVVLNAMAEVGSRIDTNQVSKENTPIVKELKERGEVQARVLKREVEMLKTKFTNQDA